MVSFDFSFWSWMDVFFRKTGFCVMSSVTVVVMTSSTYPSCMTHTIGANFLCSSAALSFWSTNRALRSCFSSTEVLLFGRCASDQVLWGWVRILYGKTYRCPRALVTFNLKIWILIFIDSCRALIWKGKSFSCNCVNHALQFYTSSFPVTLLVMIDYRCG